LNAFWCFAAAVVALALAAAALVKARKAATRFDRLSESYWDLRYEQGQIAARLERLEGRSASTEPEPVMIDAKDRNIAFVPLSSLKR
jgi:hypothetical protein